MVHSETLPPQEGNVLGPGQTLLQTGSDTRSDRVPRFFRPGPALLPTGSRATSDRVAWGLRPGRGPSPTRSRDTFLPKGKQISSVRSFYGFSCRLNEPLSCLAMRQNPKGCFCGTPWASAAAPAQQRLRQTSNVPVTCSQFPVTCSLITHNS